MRFQAPHLLYLISFSSLMTFLLLLFLSFLGIWLEDFWRYLALSRSLQAFTSMPQSECLSKSMCMRCAETE